MQKDEYFTDWHFNENLTFWVVNCGGSNRNAGCRVMLMLCKHTKVKNNPNNVGLNLFLCIISYICADLNDYKPLCKAHKKKENTATTKLEKVHQ